MVGNIYGDGPRGGIFGARIDPRLVAELERRAEEKRQMAQGLENAAPEEATDTRPTFERSLTGRILAAPSKLFGGLIFDPAVEGVTDLLTLTGNVKRGEQPTMSADPQTGAMHTDPRLIERTANAAGTLTLGAGAIPAEANALRMGIKAFRDIRPPKEDVWERSSGWTPYSTVLGNTNIGIDKLTGGVRLNNPAERKRVDALKAQMGGEDGYIERLIVDDTGHVIEGAHRLEALREMGAQHVPTTIIRDLGRNVDSDEVEAAVRAAGQVRGEQSRQVVQNVLEMANDVGLDRIEAEYALPQGFETSYRAAIKALKDASLETADQVKARLAK